MVFPEFAVHCCRHPRAAYMGITEHKNDEVNLLVPVLDRVADEPKYNLSVCLAPIYGNDSKWLLLVELIEHYKLQGVQHLYIYVKDIDNYSRMLVEDYERSGEIEVVYLRRENDRFGSEWQLAGIEDCLQRSRHHSRYAIFTDLDERILALGDQTLAEYVQKAMTEKPNIGTLTFQKTIVMRTRNPPTMYEGEQTVKNHLPTLVFHNTSAPIKEGGKCVVDPRRVLLMWIHEAYLYFPGFEGAPVPPNQALIRHYRINAGARWIARMQNNKRLRRENFTLTDYPEKLMKLLYTSVEKRLARVYPVKQSLLSLFMNTISDFIN
ncbi:unnamed protein product [Cylicocyclus nassatus]|uniref:Glycosyltransferase family 92 protein n=1 Tax=Cylicocyclus nassatus TaxID=53992 RepID=A0AA36MFC5_CYLNA|nr:unnamed protein product [Cylicocyclus nassatus]